MAKHTLPQPRDSLWLCLHFTRLALDVFDQPDTFDTYDTFNTYAKGHPIAVIEQRLVHCANRDNLPAGLALATAHALHPDLLALKRQPERECEHLHNLAHWAYQFTPGVVIANRNSLLLEIGSCRRLHHGAHNLLKKIKRSLQQRQQYAAIGLARTPKSAWLLAQCHCEPALRDDGVDEDLLQHQLAMTPIAALEIDSDAQRALQQMGLTALGALRVLPTAALGKRFGAAFVDYLQKISGEKPDPQVYFVPAPHFQHGLAFVDGIPQRQMLLFPMKRLLQALSDYLRARQLHCHTLQWQLFDAHNVQAEFSVELSVELGRTQNHWHNLLELSRLKLEQVPLATSVFSINLYCADFFESTPTAQQLFPDENDQREAAGALIDRLQARLGKEALQRIMIQESYWPELAWQHSTNKKKEVAGTIRRSAPLFAATVVGMNADTEPPWKGLRRVVANDGADRPAQNSTCRPLWLLPQPQPLNQRDNQPCWPTPLTLLRGPERIANHWWQEGASERDYYIARTQRGVICWIFHERETLRWFLHGLFA